MRFVIYLTSLVITFSANASTSDTCAQVQSLSGSTCEKLQVKLDLTNCKDEGPTIVDAKVKCKAGKASASYKSPTSKYKVNLETKEAGWGKAEFTVRGPVTRELKKSEVANNETDVDRVPATKTVELVPPPVETFKKPTDEELAALVGILSGFNFKGSVDGYYAYNLNEPASVPATPTAANTQAQNKYRAFDLYHDDLQLSYARMQIQKVTGPVTTTLDLGYGPTMQIVSGTKTDAAQINVKQAIIGYKATDKLTIEAGRFATYLGYEVIESQDNWNYSRNILFGYFVPFWHQGVKASYALNDKFYFMAMVADGWNNSYSDKKQKTYGGQMVWSPATDLVLYFNVITGQEFVPANVDAASPRENRTVYDFVSTLKVNDKLSLALNADHMQFSSHNAFGIAAYAKYQFSEKWSVSPRIEYVDDHDNLAMGETLPDGQKLSTYTLTFENKLAPNLSLKLEGRWDKSSEEVYVKDGKATSSQATGIVGVVASF